MGSLPYTLEGEELTLGMKSRARVAVAVLWVWKKKRRRVQSGCREGTSTNLRVWWEGDAYCGWGWPLPPPHSPCPSSSLISMELRVG